MKHHCSVSNLLAAALEAAASIVKWVFIGTAAFLAVIGALVSLIGAVCFAMHKPTGFRTDTQGWVLYAMCAASILGFLAYGLWKNWRKTVREGGILLADIAAIICTVWYASWVCSVVPGALDHPSRLFVGLHQALWVHFALLPAQICMVVALFALAFIACGGAWCGLDAMCKYGAELREAKAKKLAAAAPAA